MAVLVVDRFEAVEIETTQGEAARRALANCRVPRVPFEHGVEVAAVGQAGQRIGLRQHDVLFVLGIAFALEAAAVNRR